MAKLSELVQEVAAAEGVPEPTVARVARHLREAGLVAQSGRGPGAAPVSARDAANLLIGVNAAAEASAAPRAVRWYGSMVSYRRAPASPRPTTNAAEQGVVRRIGALAEYPASFGEGLLAMAAGGSLREDLHTLGLLHIAGEPLPGETHPELGPDAHARRRRERARAALAAGGPEGLAGLRAEWRDELDELIRLNAASVLVRFCRPYPGARLEVRRGGSNEAGRPEGGTCLLRASFQPDLEDDAVVADEDAFHRLRPLARSEVVTVDQRALLAVGEALGEGLGRGPSRGGVTPGPDLSGPRGLGRPRGREGQPTRYDSGPALARRRGGARGRADQPGTSVRPGLFDPALARTEPFSFPRVSKRPFEGDLLRVKKGVAQNDPTRYVRL